MCTCISCSRTLADSALERVVENGAGGATVCLTRSMSIVVRCDEENQVALADSEVPRS